LNRRQPDIESLERQLSLLCSFAMLIHSEACRVIGPYGTSRRILTELCADDIEGVTGLAERALVFVVGLAKRNKVFVVELERR
jgi:hypothetical protein